MTDIVERLRGLVATCGCGACEDAANEIERLHHEERQLQTAIKIHLGEIERLMRHGPIARRTKGPRGFSITICWDDYMISGLQKSTDEAWRLIWIDKMLKGELPDLHAKLRRIADQQLRLINSEARYTADDIETLRRDFPDLFEKCV